MAGSVSQRTVVTQAELNPKQSTGKLALFNEDGTPFTSGGGGGVTLPIEISDVNGLQAILDDYETRIAALENPV